MSNDPFATAPDRKVVVDAGIVIRGERFDRFGNEFFTTSEVYLEIRDAQARRNLQQLPVELKIREPEKEDFQAVKRFAKETGDLGSLSTNDMGLMALAVTLHRVSGVGKELRSTPELAGVIKKSVPFSWAPQTCDGSVFAQNGGASSSSRRASEFDAEVWESDSDDEKPRMEGIAEEAEEDDAADSGRKGAGKGPSEETEEKKAGEGCEDKECCHTPEKTATATSDAAGPATGAKSLTEGMEKLDLGDDDDKASTVADDKKPATARILSAAFNHSTVVDAKDHDESSDDDDGWVTVDNIRRLNNVVDENAEEEDELPGTVAIASTDYSVQNVSIQMGLKALSIDGFRIRNVKMWGKICRGCFHSTRETEKIFCPKCGNATLDRVPITLDAEGRMIVHDGRRRTKNLRGSIYSIPKYKGGHGRATKNIMLAEDEMYIGGRHRQIKYQQKLAEKQRTMNDPFENETLDGWCTRHITGNGRSVNANPHQLRHGYGRKNPNANNFKSQKFSKK